MVLKQLIIWHSAWWIVSVFSVAGFSLGLLTPALGLSLLFPKPLNSSAHDKGRAFGYCSHTLAYI